MTLLRLTPLDGDAIIPLDDAKAQLRVRHSSEDALIGSLRDAAIGHIERVSGIALATASFRWSTRTFPERAQLPMRPVSALQGVFYRDADGAEQEYTDGALVDGWVYPAIGGDWPETYDLAAFEFTAGLTDAGEAPELIAAALLMLTHLYENRSATTAAATIELPLGVRALIDSYRLMVA